jgi:hypothetical protein
MSRDERTMRLAVAVDRGCGVVEASRQTLRLERPGDLFHLANPAPALRRRRALGGREAIVELRWPLRREVVPYVRAFGVRAQCEEQRARSLRPAGKRAFESRGVRGDARLDRRAGEESGDGLRFVAGEIEARVGRAADIPPSTKRANRDPTSRAVAGAIAFAST